MKKYINVFPLEGIEVDSTYIKLGDYKETIVDLLGQPCSQRNCSIYYFENELRLDFDNDGKIEFIEFLGGIDGQIQPVIYNVKAFEEKAEYVAKLLTQKNNGKIDDCENGYSYTYKKISVGIYRSSTPEDITEMIQDSLKDGVILSEKELLYEKKRAEHWATIGIGIKGYYQ